MSTISLCMIVKNEEKVLGRCLDSVQGVVDEMIIVDTGSQDQTVAIAKTYTDKVYTTKWEGDFSKARNTALEKATCKYCLVLDADEVLEGDAKSKLKAFVRQGKNEVGRLTIRSTFMQDGKVSVASDCISRLFPTGVRYVGAIHEQLDTKLQRSDLDVTVAHDGYLANDRGPRNIPILLEEVRKNPDNVYMLYQLANQYKGEEMYQEALDYYIEAYNKVDEGASFRTQLVVSLLYVVMHLGALDVASDLIDQEEGKMQGSADFHFVKALIYVEICCQYPHMYESCSSAIEQAYLRCLAIGEHKGAGSVEGVGSYSALYNLGVYYEVNQLQSQAMACYKQSAEMGFEEAGARFKVLQQQGFEVTD